MIRQVRFSKSVEFFRPLFHARWRTRDYDNQHEPALFFGVYTKEDIDAVKAHTGFKVVRFTGADMPNVKTVQHENMIVWTPPGESIVLKKHAEVQVSTKTALIELKDFSMFRPAPLGDKVYCYVGFGGAADHFRVDVCSEVQKRIPYEIIYGLQGHSIRELKRDYYDRSFVNLRLNPFAAGLTADEMAHMGRFSISNRPEMWYINWQTVDDIVRIINEQAKSIGQTCHIPMNYEQNWQQIKFWES
jgi:hypothetical protein